MAVILTINAGSASSRLAAFGAGEDGTEAVARARVTEADGPPAAVLRRFVEEHRLSGMRAIAHRVVHGGTRLTASCWLDRDAEREIERLAPLAPLHNPHALAWIAACRAQFGRAVPQAAMFDTAFFASLPRFASTYALPAALTGHGELRRFGFHGLAHQSMLAAWGQGQGRLITVQLGSGCSIAAIRDSQAVDTSMGFTPLEGLVMSTRSGDVDPGLLLHLQVAGGHSAERLAEVLSHQSGLLGLSSRSSDMRALLAADDPASALAIEIYCYRVRKYIGAYLAALNGADAILFGGGVGENAPAIRERILSDLDGLGIVLDPVRNRATVGTGGRISALHSRVAVEVAVVDEEAIMLHEVMGLLADRGPGDE